MKTKTRFHKLTAWILTLVMLMTFIPNFTLTASAATEVYASGNLGQGNKTAWTIYDNGLLVIDGKGNSISTKWDSTTASPWKDYADIITRVSFVNCENWVRIPENTFRGLSNLKEVILPENIEEICQYAFTGTAIETIILPDGLITIGYYAFSSCESLKYININDGVTSIGSSAFYNCSSLKAISIPDSVTSIGQTLFQNCGNLEYVRLSESVDKVGGSMFSGCTMLKNISLPASVTVIGVQAFSKASNLAGVYYHGINEPTTYNPGYNNATFSSTPDTMVIYASNDYSGTTMGLKENWENDVHNVTKIDGYFVNVAHTIGGAVKVDKSIVPVGDTVTVDIMAYKNYALDTFAVTGADGNEITVAGDANTRTFAMPEGDVTITATFKSTIVPHVHSWSFEAEGTYINATCANTDGACHNPYQSVVMTPPSTKYFAWNLERTVTVSGTIEDVEIPEVVYTLKSTGEEVRPFEPDVYVASLTIENTTLTCEYEITKSNQLNYSFFTYTAPANLTYDGTAKIATIVPNSTVDAYIGDVEVLYNSSATPPINVGSYTVTFNVEESDYFTAKTNLSLGGRGGQKFSIVAKDIEDLTYTDLAASYPVGATPDVTIKYGDMTLVKDTDYTIEYANNTTPGSATMTITGIGNYTGTKTLEFEISAHEHSWIYEKQNDTTIKATCTADGCPETDAKTIVISVVGKEYDGEAVTATVTNNVDSTDYSASIVYEAKTGSLTEGKAVNVGTYTAKITVGDVTASVDFEITAKSLSGAVVTVDSNANLGYTGNAITPDVSVTLDGKTLTTNDYTVSYSDNTNVGQAIVTVTGKGNYKDTASTNFTITKATPVVTAPSVITDLTYTGQAQALINEGSTTGGTIQYSLDDVTYSTNIPTGTNAGTYTVYYKVIGNDNYNDVTANSASVTISQKTVTNPIFDGLVTTQLHTGSAIEPTFTLKDGDTEIPESEYDVAYSNNINVGEATITITDRENGNYNVSGTAKFTIAKHTHDWDISANGNVITATCQSTFGDCPNPTSTVTLVAPENLVYDGNDKVVITDGTIEGVAIPDVQYTGDRKNVGTFTASLTVDNVMATLSVTIEKAEVNNVSFDVTAPEALNEKQTTVANGTGYTAAISWNTEAEKFGFDTAYKATVALTADINHKFADTLSKDGWDVALNSDKTVATFTKIFDKTRKEKLVSLTNAPVNKTLSSYYEDINEAIAELPTTVTYETELGNKTVDIEWACANYNSVPAQTNTFAWSVKAGELTDYDVNSMTTSGNITVINVTAIGVTHSKTDKETTYDENTYDVSQLFTKGTTTGTVSYEIVAGGTGAGALSGTNLTITKAGTIYIKMSTAANAQYAASDITATLTVAKANGTGTVSMEGWTYGETAKAPAIADNKGEATYQYKARGADDSTYSSDKPSNAGDYTVKATFAETDLYKEATATADFTIAKKDITDAIVGDFAELTYTGEAQTPAATVTIDGLTVTGTWSDVTNVADTTTFTANGNFTGTIEAVDVGMAKAEPTEAPESASTARLPVGKVLYEAHASFSELLGVDGAVLTGTYEWETPDKVIDSKGDYTEKAVFTPNDENYAPIDLDVAVDCYIPQTGGLSAGGDKSTSGKDDLGTLSDDKADENNKTDENEDDTLPPEEETDSKNEESFSDVAPAAWYYDAAEWMNEKGYMSGTGKGLFSPNLPTTRGMVVTVLWRIAGQPEPQGECTFHDVRAGSYYEAAVTWAQENGVVTGHSDTVFAPDELITREQLATIIHRNEKRLGNDVSHFSDLEHFVDDHHVSDWALEAKQWAVGAGIISGTSATTLHPQKEATRAECAVILYRMNNK